MGAAAGTAAGLGLQYLLRGLLSAFISMIADAADMIGGGVVTLLQPDIGGGSSIFDIMFSSFGDLLGLFRIMALVLLFINFVWQLVKIMLTPQGAESPLSLVAGTFFAGVFIFWSTDFIRVAERIAATFYSYILNLGEQATMGSLFSGLVKDFASGFGANVPDNVGGVAVDLISPISKVKSLGQLIIILLLVLWLAYQFFLYIVEVVERYVLLGVLYYTSPMAFAFAGSKSTRNIFGAWVKMVGCQLFLMICNVFFFKMFIYGFSRFNETMAAMSGINGGETTGMMIVWVLILFGILYVGQRVDAYMSTLGLNAAQTGRGMGAALVASALGAGRAIQGMRNLGSAAYHSKPGQAAANKVSDTFSKAANKLGVSGARVPQNGMLSAKQIMDFAKNPNSINKNDLGKVNGRCIAEAFNTSVQTGKGQNRTASDILAKADKNSFRANADGSFSGEVQDGRGRAVATIRSNTDGALDNAHGQHFTTKDGSNFVMTFAPADNSAASRNLAANLTNQDVGLAEAVQKKYGDSCTISKLDNGIYNVERRDPQTNEIQEARQIAPASGYSNDACGSARHQFTVGQYHSDGDVYEVDCTGYARAKEATGYGSFVEPRYGATTPADQARCLKDNFATFSEGNAKLSDVKLWNNGQDIHTFSADTKDGRHTYAMANALEYAVNKDVVPAGVSQMIRSNNGIDYAVVDLGVSKGNGPIPNPNAAFVQNGTPGYAAVQGGVTSRGSAAHTAGIQSNGAAPVFFSRNAPASENLHANGSNSIHQVSQEKAKNNKSKKRN